MQTYLLALALSAGLTAGANAEPPRVPQAHTIEAEALVGTWTLTAADDLLPDGTRVPAYGTSPRGLLLLAADGRYAVQIYRAERPRFASGDKRRGTLAEHEAASLGMSAHFGRYRLDATQGVLVFEIEAASFPNWEGSQQKRPFTLADDELSWRVPAAPDGKTPISVWRRVRPVRPSGGRR